MVDGTQIKYRKLTRAASTTPPCDVLGSKLPPSDQVPASTSNFAATVKISIPHAHGSLLSGIRVLVSQEPFIFEQPCLIYAFNGQDRWPDVLSRLQRLQRPPKPHFCRATFCIPVSTRISWLYSRQHYMHCSGLTTHRSRQRSSALRGDIAEPCAAENDSPWLYPDFSKFDAASCCICLHCTRPKE
jgi:hypothetical protein